MRTVLHLINTAGPGGAETVFLGLVTNLDRSRWRSLPVLPNPEWLSERLGEAGVDPVFLRSRVPIELSDLGQLHRLVRERQVDLIHSHLFGPSVVATMLGRVTGVPVIATIHGVGDLHPDERFRSIKFRLLNQAHRVVFVSESLRSQFLRAGPLRAERTAVVPNGIDPEAFRRRGDRTLRQQWGIGEDDFLVGAVGNLRAAKGYDVLLHAAAELIAHRPGYRFVIVGQSAGELGSSLVELRDRLGLGDAVRFLGYRDDVPAILSCLDLYAITSRSEGFSIATVQAMAAGLPVVATRCGGPEEIIDDGITGVLVDSERPDQVTDAIDRLRADPARRIALGALASAAVEQRFSIQAQVASYERLYEAAIRS